MQNKQALQSKLERLFMPDTTLSDQQLIDTFLPYILENEAKGVLQDLLIQTTLAMQSGSSVAAGVFMLNDDDAKALMACA
ncbi:hypothetical protein [Pseudomonas sp. NPDC087817]|uniref:hypothetical protein n=1 Tax=Pseudomonas sp. NPDC087817 TaxID=3364451 RepID=UPI003814E545